MKAHYLLFTGIIAGSCARQPEPDSRSPECPNCGSQEKFYYFADTVFTRHDSVFVVNKRMHQTVVETGLFAYLPYGYPIQTPDELIRLMKAAARAENAGNVAQAMRHYKDAVSFYQQSWLTRKGGFENGGFSDLNEFLAYHVNVSLLASFAAREFCGGCGQGGNTKTPHLGTAESQLVCIGRAAGSLHLLPVAAGIGVRRPAL